MPFASRDGVRLYWRLEGRSDRPVLLLLSSLGADLSLWDRVAPLLLPRYRLLRLDARGHGASDVPPGDYRLQELAADALAVMDAAGVERAVPCGIALGGAVALSLALAAPARVRALICACSTAQVRAADWNERIRQVRAQGMRAAAEAAIARSFSDAFRQAHAEIVGSLLNMLLHTDPQGYAGAAAAVRDGTLAEHLGAIQQPVLLLSGTRDVATPFEPCGAQLLAALPNAAHVSLEAAHLACLEAPGPFAAAVDEFLRANAAASAQAPPAAQPSREVQPPSAALPLQAAAQALYTAGLQVRRAVLGDDWVDRALAATTPFNQDFQAMITRSAWQEIWSRPGLDQRTRRLLVLATCVALGRWEEFRLHVRSGLMLGGFSEEELREVLMQAAVYVGVPAANHAFAEATEVLRALQRLG